MNDLTLAPAPAPILERLMALTTDEVLSEENACICATREHGVRSADIDHPTFAADRAWRQHLPDRRVRGRG
jgi:hypothetical protein